MDKVKSLLVINIRVIVRFYLKSIFSRMKSNSKNISLKNNFSYLKSIFSYRKNKPNMLHTVDLIFILLDLILELPKCKPKRLSFKIDCF